MAFIAGDLKERRRCTEFIQWLLQQRRGSITIPDVSQRDDVTEVRIPTNSKGWITADRGSELRHMEQKTGTYMFIALDGKGDERLLIFGVDEGAATGDSGRVYAHRLVMDMCEKVLHDDDLRRARGRARRGRGRSYSSSRSRGRSRSRRRSRS